MNAQLLYVSYRYPLPNPRVTQLGGLLERTRDKGYEVRVVVLSDQYDMGSVDSLWRKPQQYARFLAQEIALLYKGRLLIVMPNGYGFNYPGHESTRELKLLATVPIKADDGILRSAETAVQRLAAGAGVRVTAPPLMAAPTRSSEPSPLTGYRAKKASRFQPGRDRPRHRRRVPPRRGRGAACSAAATSGSGRNRVTGLHITSPRASVAYTCRRRQASRAESRRFR